MWRHFILPPCTTRGWGSSNAQLGSASARVPVYYLVSSVVVVGVEDRPPLGDLGCALRHRPALVLRSHPGVAPWLPHEGLANGEGGRGHELVPPGAVLRQVCPLGEHRQPGGERARKQGLRWCKIINVVPATKKDEASTAARIPRSQVFPGGRGHYEQIGRLLRGTWTCERGPAARGSGMVSLGSKLG